MDRKRASSSIVISGANAMTVGAVNRSEWDPSNKGISSYAYDQERDRFMKDLRRFHDGRGTSIIRIPCVGGRPLDLYTLYNVVTQLGGWEKVTNEDLWPDVQERLKIPKSCTNADYGLRQMYIRFLHHFERVYRFGQDPDSRDDGLETEDASSSRRKTSGSILGVSFTYNYYQHNLSDGMRDMLGVSSKEMIQANEYTHLERSLLSRLPNEVDFAMNVSLLLSHEGRPAMSGTKGRRIIDCLLSCVGLYRDGFSSKKSLLENGAAIKFLQFWNDTVEDRGIRELACPECLLINEGSCKSLLDTEQSDDVETYWISNRGHRLGSKDSEGPRVTQLAMILRNLSFEEENLDVLSSNLLLVRFLMLCIHNKYGCLRQLAFDTLSNLAHKMVLEPTNCRLTQLVLKTVKQSISSMDKLEVITALETLSRMCQVDINEDAVCSQLDDSVYDQIIALLTIHDIPILVAVLEALYQLSELGPVTTMRIAQSTTAITILLDLLTLEIQSYGPESLAGSKVVEYVHVSALPNRTSNAESNPNFPQNCGPVTVPAPGQLMGPPARPPPASGNSMIRQPQIGQEAPVTTPGLPPPGVFAMPRVPGIGSAMPCSIPNVGVPARIISAPMLVGAQAPGIGIDGEAVARSWLQSQFEFRAEVGSGVTRTDMYKRYVASCSTYGIQNLLNPSMFAACVRVVFPVAEMEPINREGSVEVLYKGLCPRQPQLMMATMAERNQMMTAGHPVILRPPVQSVRQQLVMATVDQATMPKTPIFSSIHQALIGNIRPNTDFVHQPSGVSNTNFAIRDATTLGLRPNSIRHESGIASPVVGAVAISASNDTSMSNSVQGVLSSTIHGVSGNNATESKSQIYCDAVANNSPNSDVCLTDSILKTDISGTSSINLPMNSLDQSKTLSSDVSLVGIKVEPNGLSNEAHVESSAVSVPSSNQVSNSGIGSSKIDSWEIKTHINGGAHVNGPVVNDVYSEDNMCKNNGNCDLSSITSGFVNPVVSLETDASSEICTTKAPVLVNGHKFGLPNGNCSPVPSCNSDDPDTVCNIKRRKAVFVNGIDGDHEDDSTGPIEIDDVLCKAMIRADIIHGVGHPADVNDDDEDSGMSVDFVTGFMSNNTGEALDNSTAAGYDEEAATAVAGLLKDEDMTSDFVASKEPSEVYLPTTVPCDDIQLCSESVMPSSNDIKVQVIPATLQQPSSLPQAMCSIPVNTNQIQQTRFVLARAPFPFAMAGATPAVQKASSGCILQQERANGPQAALASGQLHNGMSNVGETAAPCMTEAAHTSAPLPNGLMFSPQWSTTGQVVPAGVRLLIRPSGAGTAPYLGGPPPVSIVSWNGPVLSATCQSSLGSGGSTVLLGQSGLPTLVSSSSLNSACMSSLVPCASSGQSVQLSSIASITSTHSQLVLQHGQLLSSSSASPMFHQRVILPRPITIARPDGQVLIQPPPAPSAGVLPLIATQASLGHLRLAAASAPTCAGQPNISGGQSIILNHPMISLPTRPSSSQNLAGTVKSDSPLDDPSTSNQIPYLVRPHPPGQAFFSPQHPVRLLGNAVQLHSGLVQGNTPGSNPLIIQHGGRQIFLQPQGASTGQPSPGYMMFRPGTAALIAPRPPLNQEPSKDDTTNIAVSSSATSVVSNPECSTMSRKRSAPVPVGSRSLRKRKMADDDSADGDVFSSPSVSSISKPANLMFVCEWSGCQKCFETFKQIYKHVTKEHFESNSTPTFTCQWAGCDSLPRQRWSFMTHLQDRHLNENLLRLAAEQRWRQQLSQDAQLSSRTAAAPPPPIYPPNAALQAIRRFSARPPFPELMDAPEGPVTKHVRLTAALILRNLARYSSQGRSTLRRHEQLLSYMAFSNVEASVALSHCLHELQKH